MHYDGTTWTIATSGAPGDLNAIWAAPQTISGRSARSDDLHYDGKNWTSVQNNIINSLNAVYGLSSTNVWTVGDLANSLPHQESTGIGTAVPGGRCLICWMASSWELGQLAHRRVCGRRLGSDFALQRLDGRRS